LFEKFDRAVLGESRGGDVRGVFKGSTFSMGWFKKAGSDDMVFAIGVNPGLLEG
jgi:hypothetical protein